VLVVIIAAAMIVVEAAPSEQCLLNMNGYSICLYGANYDYSGPISKLSVGVGTYGIYPWPWLTTIGQKTENDMQSQLLAMYQQEGNLVNYDIKPISNTVAYGHPTFWGRSSLYLMYFGGSQLEPGRFESTTGHYDMIFDIGNNRCCYLSSITYDGLMDMVDHVVVEAPWGRAV
jgi:hypothetical protein